MARRDVEAPVPDEVLGEGVVAAAKAGSDPPLHGEQRGCRGEERLLVLQVAHELREALLLRGDLPLDPLQIAVDLRQEVGLAHVEAGHHVGEAGLAAAYADEGLLAVIVTIQVERGPELDLELAQSPHAVLEVDEVLGEEGGLHPLRLHLRPQVAAARRPGNGSGRSR